MNPRDPQPPQEDLLSAFFDAEVSPAERRVVEQLLDDSEDARRELEAFGQLRRCLQHLPRPTAPADLQAAVWSRIQPEGPQLSPGGAGNRTIRHGWLAAFCAAAAVLALMVWMPGRPADRRGATSIVATSEKAFNERPAFVELAAAQDADALPQTAASSLAGGAVAENAAIDAPAAMDLVGTPPNSEDWLRDEILSRGRIPDRGEVLKYLDREADRVLLVTVSVVDVDIAPGQIRMLLARNGIEEVAPPGEGFRPPAALAGAEGAGGALAILAITDPVLLATVLDEIDTMELVDSYRVDEPAPASSIAAATQAPATDPALIAKSGRSSQTVGDPGDARTMEASQAPSRTAVADPDRAGVAAAPRNGVQMAVTIPPELLRAKFAPRPLSSRSAVIAGDSSFLLHSKGVRSEAARPGQENRENPRAMPVLFVIQSRSPGR